MKRWNILYENCKLPIRVAYFGFVLIAIGFLVQSESVNIFYTIQSPQLIILSEACLRIGETIIVNLPLIFMANLVAKRANSGMPLISALVGYITFTVFTMIFMTKTLPPQVYTNTLGITFSSSLMSGVRSPLHTGLIGSFLVAFATRFTYLHSRNRSSYSFLGFLHKDTAALIYNVVLCALLGFGAAFLYPYCFELVQQSVEYIARDLSDPVRIGLYGFLDRFLSILGLGNLIRYPFWYTSLGGSYMTLAGQTILGDVNIWECIQEASLSFAGCGRFITAYYVINLFVCPAIYLGMFLSINDKKDRKKNLLFLLGASFLSILVGNPLPLELTLLFTSPLLLVFYLLVVATLFGIFSFMGVFLGFSYSGITSVAMPGSFVDYIIHLRDPLLFDAIVSIFLVGVCAFVVCYIATRLYYRYFAYDILNSGKTKALVEKLAEAVGGFDNIEQATSGLLRLNLYLKDLEAVSFAALHSVGARRITETRDGISIDFGSSSTVIASAITKMMAKMKRQ